MTNNIDKNTANTNVELSEEQLDGVNGAWVDFWTLDNFRFIPPQIYSPANCE